MKILFMDLDGVLNTPDTKRPHHGEYLRPRDGTAPPLTLAIDPGCAVIFNRIVAETECKVVLSTSWRDAGTLEELHQALADGGIECEVIDKTQDALNDPAWKLRREQKKFLDRFERGDEIRDWLERHPEIEEFVILDDCDDMSNLRSCLVQTDGAWGLQEVNIGEVLEVLPKSREVLTKLRGQHDFTVLGDTCSTCGFSYVDAEPYTADKLPLPTCYEWQSANYKCLRKQLGQARHTQEGPHRTSGARRAHRAGSGRRTGNQTARNDPAQEKVEAFEHKFISRTICPRLGPERLR